MQGAPQLRDGSWIHGGVWRLLAWGPPLLVVLAALRYGTGWPAPVRLAVTTLVLYAALKATAILRQSRGELLRASPAGRLAYLTVWPGMSLAPFQVRGAADAQGRGWLRGGLVRMGLGGFAMVVLSLWAPRLSDGIPDRGLRHLRAAARAGDQLSGRGGLGPSQLLLPAAGRTGHLGATPPAPTAMAGRAGADVDLVLAAGPAAVAVPYPLPPGAGSSVVPPAAPGAVVSPSRSERSRRCRLSGC